MTGLPRKAWNCFNMSRNKIMRRISLLKLCVLTLICLVIFSFSFGIHTISFKVKSPSLKSLLGPALKLIQENGKIHVDDIEALDNLSDEEKVYALRLLRKSLKMLQKECLKKNDSDSCYIPNRDSFLTIFTTWVYDKEKLSLNNRTLHNWRSLTGVNVIVFSNCSKVKQISEEAGWTVLPVTREAADCPVLPNMFLEAQQKFKSNFYGYANGDLLFSNGLMNTLQKIFCKFRNDKRLLIVGKRTNVFASLLKEINSRSGMEVEDYAIKYGKRFQPDALDYFITNQLFPWDDFLPLVVGRRGYDNWVLAFARYNNFTVIDASDSVTCLHQTLDERGNYEGLHKGKHNDYNIDIIDRQDVSMWYAKWGYSYCSEWRTWLDLCDTIVIGQREHIPSDCYAESFSKWLFKIFGFRKM